jgi:type IV fimbrial biogenesis protein FimT
VNNTASNQKGLTLLELLIVVAIASILLSVGVPSFRGVIMDSRLSDESNSFVASINAARSSAVRYQRNVTICPINDYEAVLPNCVDSTDWSNGYMVWVDRNRDSMTSAGEVLAVQEPMHSSLTFQSIVSSEMTYDARGFLVTGGDDLLICDDRSGEEGRVIRINGVGRTDVARQVCL